MTRFWDMFGRKKTLIAMAHLHPLPGTPLYDQDACLDGVLAALGADLKILLAAGFDAVLFCNEGDRPYTFKAGYDGVASMTRVVTELAPRDRPFGVDFLWDPMAALAIAVATGAAFMREVVTGVYESDMGFWTTDAAQLLRERRRLSADKVAVFMNVTPEFASPIGSRSAALLARSAVVSSLADAILVSGAMAGMEPNIETVREVKAAVGSDTPVLVNTGAKSTNIRDFLKVADGAIVGSDLKRNGLTLSAVDPERARCFIEAARQ
jgi:uncharacterized protein